MINCNEFKMEYAGKVILAFATDEVTHLFKFEARYITFFMRKFIDDRLPYWRNIHFYEVANLNVDITEEGKITKFEDKAKFLYIWAKRLDQKGGTCVFRRIFLPPDLTLLEGCKAKVTTLSFD